MEVKIGIEDVRKILEEKFPFYDNTNSSWELADEEETLDNVNILYGTARSHWYKVTLNGKTYYSLRNGIRFGVYFYLSREDALNDKECEKEDILLDYIKNSNKYKNFFLSNSVYRRKRVWKVWFLDKEDISVELSIEQMLRYMRDLYRKDSHTDLARCIINKNCRLYIDGTSTHVSISLSNGCRREFFLGYEVSSISSNWDDGVKDTLLQIPLKDYFSDKKLGSQYKF